MEQNNPAITGVNEFPSASNDSSIPVIMPCFVSSTFLVNNDLNVGKDKEIPKFIRNEFSKKNIKPMLIVLFNLFFFKMFLILLGKTAYKR